MKRLLFFCMIVTMIYGIARPAMQERTEIPVLEIPDEQEDDDGQELLDSTIAIEPPLYMRILMKIGSESAAGIIYLHRAIVARCKLVTTWWAGS